MANVNNPPAARMVQAQQRDTGYNRLPIEDLGHLQQLPEELRRKIFKAALPSGKIYTFSGQLRAPPTDVPTSGMFFVNRQMQQDAMRIWLEENIFDFFAGTLSVAQLGEVRSDSGLPSEDNIESCIAWIARMSRYTGRIDGHLYCRDGVGSLFPQFFEITKLLQKYEVNFIVDGRFPRFHRTKFHPWAPGINITLAPGTNNLDKLRKTHLMLLESAHFMRAQQQEIPMKTLSNVFESVVLIQGGNLLSMSPPNETMGIMRCPIPETSVADYTGPRDFQYPAVASYAGPGDFLYPTPLGAMRALRAVYKGEQPRNLELTPDWARRVVEGLKAYRVALSRYRNSLFRAKGLGRDGIYEQPMYDLPCPHVFYGAAQISAPVTKKMLKHHIWACNGDMYRVNAHIAAMEPYCEYERQRLDIPIFMVIVLAITLMLHLPLPSFPF